MHENPPQSDGEQAFVCFAQTVLRLVDKWVEADGEPHKPQEQWQFTESVIRRKLHLRNDYVGMLDRHMRDVLTAIDNIGALVDQVGREGIGTRLGKVGYDNQPDGGVYATSTSLLTPLGEMMERLGTLHPTADQIRVEYRRYRHAHTCRTLPLHSYHVLSCFESELAEFCIGPLFRIKPLTNEEKNGFCTGFGFPMPLDFDGLRSARFQMHEVHPYSVEPSVPLSVEATRVINAFRLLKRGDVVVCCDRTECKVPYACIGGLIAMHPPGRHRTVYRFSEGDVARAESLRNALCAIDDGQNARDLEVALRRFEQSYTRKVAEDRLIDLTIALESTLLAWDSDELKYRLSLRGAALTAAFRNPYETQQLLKVIYDVRSAVVHDGKHIFECSKVVNKALASFAPPNERDDLAQMCEDVVRDILRTYVERLATGKGLAQVNADIDTAILAAL